MMLEKRVLEIGQSVKAITSKYGVIIGELKEKSIHHVNGYYYYGVMPYDKGDYRLIWVREDLITPIANQARMKGL